ncbi:hypothetical protein Poli38472_000296 [Pythium oligandrum]|uniref:Uncharacterized protein n=1 Tax=Pythium oligandrum TaxID=41045 RepID=A0A8K1FGQ4_PYTOL|nr:hypothetical protein Poli38472_000296 [Pythium oligandrum]|eukprot:TMW60254.1 hypothetical protein Poli38472_000296 [Pythium oligandrum]
MSAKPVSSCLTSSLSQRFDDDILSDLDGDEDDIIQDDEDEDVDGMEFGEALERANRQTKQKQKIPIPISVLGNSRGKAFRPTSAPVSRTKPTAQLGLSNKHFQHTKHNDRSVISITYLKEAAEKKKQRDRDFARELLREENEYKRKMTQKIEHANKMSSAFGSKRTFSLAPDRDGLHMIRVTDPESTDRVISVENFHILSLQLAESTSTTMAEANANPNADQAKRYIQEFYKSQAEEGEEKKTLSCRWFLDRAFLCVTPGNQMTHYYRYGRADECKGTWTNMYDCFRASLMDDERRLEYLKGTDLDPTVPPHKTDVWEEKEKPGW